MDFRSETIPSLVGKIKAREVSAREVLDHALARIDALNPEVNAFVAVDAESARRAAAAVDERAAGGEEVGPLAGVPIGVKDLEDAAGFTTTYGSALFADQPPATADSSLVTRLKAAGCVVVGKTNTPELGWKADTDSAPFGATRNPWSLAHSPGGSSGGSAAAIAAGMVPLATGSDGGGSIRIPSSLCGLSGIKPSLGRVPSGGPRIPDWHDLSTKGPLARRVGDVVAALDVCVGPDPTDLRSLPRPEASWIAAVDDAKVPMRVAWSPTLGYAPLDDEVRTVCEKAVRLLEEMGADVVEVESLFPEDPISSWLTLANAYNLRTLDEHRGSERWGRVDPGLVSMVEWATTASALDIVRALDDCHRLNYRLVELFRGVRLLVTPVTASPPPRSGELGLVNGQSDVNWVRFTYPFNLTRSPAATVCAGFTARGLPIGIQLVGPQHADLVVIRSAAALEAALGLDPVAPIG
jgi:Asp-tRNA(Asn)/Glu-tRNA(Gln) amidotransferase A subunit family amidase